MHNTQLRILRFNYYDVKQPKFKKIILLGIFIITFLRLFLQFFKCNWLFAAKFEQITDKLRPRQHLKIPQIKASGKCKKFNIPPILFFFACLKKLFFLSARKLFYSNNSLYFNFGARIRFSFNFKILF